LSAAKKQSFHQTLKKNKTNPLEQFPPTDNPKASVEAILKEISW
jgi:hypothetical protein